MDEVCVGHRLFPQGLGLTEQAAGGLADGVIALEGQWLGAYTFVSLNRRAVAPLRKHSLGSYCSATREACSLVGGFAVKALVNKLSFLGSSFFSSSLITLLNTLSLDGLAGAKNSPSLAG